jgi:kinesin family protein 1
VGRPDAAVPQDIVLIGTHILSEHCTLSNTSNELVELTPCPNSLCYVNGKNVEDVVSLKSGDRVIFGKSHVFRFNNPEQARKEKKLAASSPITPVSETIPTGMKKTHIFKSILLKCF